MGLLMLSAGFGSTIKISITGDDANLALEKITDLVIVRQFDEE